MAGATPSDRSAGEWAVHHHVIYCVPLLSGKCRHSKLIPVHRLQTSSQTLVCGAEIGMETLAALLMF